MKVVEHDSAAAFLERATPWLLTRPAENNLPLGIARAVDAAGGKAFFATVERGSEILLAAVWTPPHRVIVTAAEEDPTRALVDYLVSKRLEPRGALSSTGTADAFARQWALRTAASVRTAFEERLYVLREVVWPTPPPGALRRAQPSDIETVAAWTQRFSTDAGLEPISADGAQAMAEDRISKGSLYLWDTEGPVSMACLTRACPPDVAVGYVYTPDARRGRGYAKACVAALSQVALDQGFNECVLYADLANPVPNRVYTTIGYAPCMDIRLVDFERSA